MQTRWFVSMTTYSSYYKAKKCLASTPMRALYSLRISSSNFTKYSLFLFLEAKNFFIASSLVVVLFIVWYRLVDFAKIQKINEEWRTKSEEFHRICWRTQNQVQFTYSMKISVRRWDEYALKGWKVGMGSFVTIQRTLKNHIYRYSNIYNRARKLIILFLKQIRKYSHSCMDEHW